MVEVLELEDVFVLEEFLEWSAVKDHPLRMKSAEKIHVRVGNCGHLGVDALPLVVREFRYVTEAVSMAMLVILAAMKDRAHNQSPVLMEFVQSGLHGCLGRPVV